MNRVRLSCHRFAEPILPTLKGALPSRFNGVPAAFMEQLPADRQAYFTQKAAANKWTVLAVFAVGALIVAYESARVRDLGFDALRVLVYVPMSVALLAAGVVVPVLNRRRYQLVVRQYAFNEAQQEWTLTLLHNERQVLVRKAPVVGQFTYFGKEYAAQVFTQSGQTWHFPLAPATRQPSTALSQG